MAQQQEPPTTTTTTTTTSTPKYELLYHPGIPGRGEFIRLALESQKIPYTDIANPSSSPSSSSSSSAYENGYATVQRICMNPHALESEAGNPPVFSPPGLRVCFASKGGQGEEGEEGNRKTLVISQTPNILIYLGEKIPGLVGGEVKGKGKGKGDGEGEDDEEEEREKKKFWIQQLMMTALDLNNEVHDTHHPIAGKKRKYPISCSLLPLPLSFYFPSFKKKRKRKKKPPFSIFSALVFFSNPID